MNRTYLITGAGSGIGRAIALQLASEKNNCILAGRNMVNLQKTLINLDEGNHDILPLDINSEKSLENALSKIKKPLDGLIANAGTGGENHWGENDRWEEIIQTNLGGTYRFVNTFLPLLRQSKSEYKHILITSSVLARLGVADYSAYCASKAGLLGLMRSWAVQFAPEKILVNAICPGWVNTQMSQEGMEGIAGGLNISCQEFYHLAMQSVPLRKMSEPEEIGELVSFLLRQHSMTGQAIDMNNGSVMNS